MLRRLTELGERLSLLIFTSLLKYVIKNTDEQPDTEIHRVRLGRSFCPCGVGACHPPGMDVFTDLEAL